MSSTAAKMASVILVNQLPCKSLKNSAPKTKLMPNAAVNRINFSITKVGNRKQNFRVGVVSDDEWGPDSVVVMESEPDIDILKKQLVDCLYGTNRGLSASNETRAEIVELITQLEATNPNPAPTQALTLLNGKWILA